MKIPFLRMALASVAAYSVPAQAQAVQNDTAGVLNPDNEQAPGATVDNGSALSDIVVTARRRAEPLQQTPLAVSAVTPARLEEAHVNNVAQLGQLVPSFNIIKNPSNPGSLFGFLRGFGSKSSDPSSEPALSLNIDGIYQAASIGSVVNLFDVESVEVLRGPQGTLLGKNSPAGGISIRTRRPGDDFGGMLQLDYGRFGDFQIRSYVDAPIAQDKLSATVSYYRRRSDGYIRSLLYNFNTGGDNTQSIRFGILAKPNENVTWYLTAQYDTNKAEGVGYRSVVRNTADILRVPGADYSISPPPRPRICTTAATADACTVPLPGLYETQADFLRRRNDKGFSITSDLAVDAGAVSFAMVSGYRYFRELAFADNDGTHRTGLHSQYDARYRQFSNEIRLASNEGGGLDMGGRLNWLVGAYYFHSEYDRLNTGASLGGPPTPALQTGLTDSFALFGHVEFKLTDELIASAGARQTWDRKTHTYRNATAFINNTPEIPERGKWDNFSKDATLEYHLSHDKMVFVRYAEGYRGGGFVGVPATASAAGSFEPETVRAYELGIKADFFNNRARVNISGFINKYDNLQRTITEPSPAPPFFVQRPQNIAKATTQGIEVETQFKPVPQLTLRANVGYLDAHYDSFVANISGSAVRASDGANNPATNNTQLAFPYTSKWTALVGGTYEADLGSSGKLTFSADYNYRSAFNVTDLNYAFAQQKGYGLLSATITWRDPSEHVSISVYGDNLTNKYYFYGGDPSGGLVAYVVDGAPRTWGISAGYKF